MNGSYVFPLYMQTTVRPQLYQFMLWGRFDDRITAIFSAKDLRTRLRQERLRNATHAAKSYALRAIIDDELRSRSLRAKLAERSEMFNRASSQE